jgi:outer membrane protein OmpA-like peptidoglycan-associated protein
MTRTRLVMIMLMGSILLVLAAGAASAQISLPNPGDALKGKLEKEVNDRLLEESQKNQCSFKTDSDVLEAGCDQKVKSLATTMIDVKKKLTTAGISGFKFEVSGHTDTRGKADHNKELSAKRAAVMVKELISRGIPKDEIISIGMGSERPLVKPDDTAAKQAKNRRYEIQVRM